MELAHAQTLLQEALLAGAILSAAPLAVCFAAGLIVSILQAATQIQEQSVTFLAKIAAVGALGYFFAQQGAALTVEFAEHVLEEIAVLEDR